MARIVSRFTVNNDAWGASGDGTASYGSASGKDGGGLVGTDQATGGTWWFEAPDKFLGDLGEFYAGTFSFDYRRSAGSTFDEADLRVTGANGQVLLLDLPTPGTDWATFTVALDTSSAWRIGSLDGPLATEAQIRAVLAEVTGLSIRGEHVSGADQGFLDNVVLATADDVDADAAGAVISDFGRTDEGWTAVGDVESVGRAATGGQSGGYLRYVDAAAGSFVYYSAPDEFLNDKSAFYGGTLAYALKVSLQGNSDGTDLILSGGGLSIVLDTGTWPGGNWTPYSVTLDTSAGWKVGNLDGPAATEANIRQVLGAVEELLILGEYVNGEEEGGLDTVVLRAPGAPAQSWELFDSPAETALKGVFSTLPATLAEAAVGDAVVFVAPNGGASNLGGVTVGVDALTIRAGAALDATFNLGAGVASLTLSDGTNADVNGNNLANTITGGAGANRLNGAGGSDILNGGSGLDTLVGGAGVDQMDGGFGSDTVDYGASTSAVGVTLRGATASRVSFGGVLSEETVRNIENVIGGSAADRLTGDGSANRLEGRGGADVLVGSGGGDTLLGDAGNDVLTGGAGKDELWGGTGPGADRFDYNFMSESRVGAANRDVIHNWDASDRIDLIGLDANATEGGNQDFVLDEGGSADTNVAQGHVKVYHSGGNTYVVANQTADTTADFQIFIVGVHNLTEANFFGLVA